MSLLVAQIEMGEERRALRYSPKNVPFAALLFGSRCDDTRRGSEVELKMIARFQTTRDEKIDVAVFGFNRLTPAEQTLLAVVGAEEIPLAA